VVWSLFSGGNLPKSRAALGLAYLMAKAARRWGPLQERLKKSKVGQAIIRKTTSLILVLTFLRGAENGCPPSPCDSRWLFLYLFVHPPSLLHLSFLQTTLLNHHLLSLYSPLPSLPSDTVPEAVGSSQHLLLSSTSFSTLIIIVVIIVSFCRSSRYAASQPNTKLFFLRQRWVRHRELLR